MAIRKSKGASVEAVEPDGLLARDMGGLIPEPGLEEEVLGELEHGGLTVEALANTLERSTAEVDQAVRQLIREGLVMLDFPPPVVVAKALIVNGGEA